jgi:hypothetical protein
MGKCFVDRLSMCVWRERLKRDLSISNFPSFRNEFLPAFRTLDSL